MNEIVKNSKYYIFLNDYLFTILIALLVLSFILFIYAVFRMIAYGGGARPDKENANMLILNSSVFLLLILLTLVVFDMPRLILLFRPEHSWL